MLAVLAVLAVLACLLAVLHNGAHHTTMAAVTDWDEWDDTSMYVTAGKSAGRLQTAGRILPTITTSASRSAWQSFREPVHLHSDLNIIT